MTRAEVRFPSPPPSSGARVPDQRRAARAKPLDTVVDAGQVREKERRGRDALRTEESDHGKPVERGQHAVEDDDVEGFSDRQFEASASIRRNRWDMAAR